MAANNTTETVTRGEVKVLAAGRISPGLWHEVKRTALDRKITAQDAMEEALQQWVARNGAAQ